ncbi:TPA: streptococcal pyrogenic exotoxin SpeI, partial [Streptococcus pyogenes]|nr:streptococcal pyrogenic exotoxin SpeI [Streptococcus pyogenes]
MSSVGVINLRNLYSTYDPTEVKGKINEGPPFSGSLFYKNIPYGNSSIELKVELNSVEKANFFSGKRVDIFTLEYSPPCNSNIKKNSYGGITLSDGNRIDKKNIPVNIFIDGVQQKYSYTDISTVSTDKKEVTIQELDVKSRYYLQKHFNIYGFGDVKDFGRSSRFQSGFEEGNIIFHLNSGERISYNLFDTGHGDRESMLKKYSDNKTAYSDQLHID